MFDLRPLIFNLLRQYINWNKRRKLGLVVRSSYCGSYRFSYLSNIAPRSTTSSLLLLHRFTDTKDTWLSFIKHLPRNQHVVALDIPGHGDTSRPGSEENNIWDYTTRINQFVQSIGLNKRPFHLAGVSLGGDIAGIYAARYPAHLSTLTLICPPGIQGPTETEFYANMRKMLNQNVNCRAMPLNPSTVEEFEAVLKILLNTKVKIPRSVIKGMLIERCRYYDFYQEMLVTHLKSPFVLHELLPQIKTPLHVIWGTNDKLAHVSGATVVKEVLPDCQVALLDNCGHSVHLEQPRKCAKLVMDFLTAHEVDKEIN